MAEPPSWRVIVTALVQIAAVATLASAVLPWTTMWPCVLFEHFRVQCFVGGASVAACAGALQVPKYFDAAVIATLLHALPLAADLGRSARPVPAGVPLRVLSLNVETQSTGFAEVRRLIDELKPDVIGLVEVDRRWLDEIAPAVASYQGRLERTRDDNFGVALYTKLPLTGAIETLGPTVPSAVAQVAVGDTRLGIVLIHPLPPMSSGALADQLDQLDAVADRARGMATQVIVMGDFNATPWSAPFRRVVERSGLCDSRAGFGLQASWPTWSTIMRIPIDHVLASCSIGIVDRRIERSVGSDHFPVVIDLVLGK